MFIYRLCTEKCFIKDNFQTYLFEKILEDIFKASLGLKDILRETSLKVFKYAYCLGFIHLQ